MIAGLFFVSSQALISSGSVSSARISAYAGSAAFASPFCPSTSNRWTDGRPAGVAPEASAGLCAAAPAGDPRRTRCAVASASRSKRSDGSDTRSPSPVSVPATGPRRCWMTWVSSCARVWRSPPPSPITMWLPEV